MDQPEQCSHCDGRPQLSFNRRNFLQTAALTAVAASASRLPRLGAAEETAAAQPESLVKKLYDTLTPKQKEEICFEWDHQDDRGLLRTHVSNNWSIVEPEFNVGGKFFTSDQQDMIKEIFFGLYNPDWRERILKQLKDDADGYGKHQTIAIFGEPGSDKFEFVMTGRHLTLRCDGNTTENVAFGGPLFYGHAASGFNEQVGHPGNVFWHQALKANGLLKMLDGKQREQALIPQAPSESKVEFQGKGGKIAGVPVSELSKDQQAHAQEVLKSLIEPYRTSDRDEVIKCLEAQGGLEQCRLAFYQSGDLGDDKVYDIWRLEGPAFVWHYRGTPHVHVWVNVASDPAVKLNARG